MLKLFILLGLCAGVTWSQAPSCGLTTTFGNTHGWSTVTYNPMAGARDNFCQYQVCYSGNGASALQDYGMTSVEATTAKVVLDPICNRYFSGNCPGGGTQQWYHPSLGACPRCACQASEHYNISFKQINVQGETCYVQDCIRVDDMGDLNQGTACYNGSRTPAYAWAYNVNQGLQQTTSSGFSSTAVTVLNEFTSRYQGCSNLVAPNVYCEDVNPLMKSSSQKQYWMNGSFPTDEFGIVAANGGTIGHGWQPINVTIQTGSGWKVECMYHRCDGGNSFTSYTTDRADWSTAPQAQIDHIRAKCSSRLTHCYWNPQYWKWNANSVPQMCSSTYFCLGFTCEIPCTTNVATNNYTYTTYTSQAGNSYCVWGQCNYATGFYNLGTFSGNVPAPAKVLTSANVNNNLNIQNPLDMNPMGRSGPCPPANVSFVRADGNNALNLQLCGWQNGNGKGEASISVGVDPRDNGRLTTSTCGRSGTCRDLRYGCFYNSTCRALGAEANSCQWARVTYDSLTESTVASYMNGNWQSNTCADVTAIDPSILLQSTTSTTTDYKTCGSGWTRPYPAVFCYTPTKQTRDYALSCYNSGENMVMKPPYKCNSNNNLKTAMMYKASRLESVEWFRDVYRRAVTCAFNSGSSGSSEPDYRLIALNECPQEATNYIAYTTETACGVTSRLHNGLNLNMMDGDGYYYAAQEYFKQALTSYFGGDVSTKLSYFRSRGCDYQYTCDVTNGGVSLTLHMAKVRIETDLTGSCNTLDTSTILSRIRSAIGTGAIASGSSALTATWTNKTLAVNGGTPGCRLVYDVRLRSASDAYSVEQNLKVNKIYAFTMKSNTIITVNNQTSNPTYSRLVTPQPSTSGAATFNNLLVASLVATALSLFVVAF